MFGLEIVEFYMDVREKKVWKNKPIVKQKHTKNENVITLKVQGNKSPNSILKYL